MIISPNTQLGLRFKENNVKVNFLELMKNYFLKKVEFNHTAIKILEEGNDGVDLEHLTDEQVRERIKLLEELHASIPKHVDSKNIREKVTELVGSDLTVIINDTDSSYYLICDSVYSCAELIKINDNFTGRTIKDIKLGKYTYLLGKNRMIRFICVVGAINGYYYDDKEQKAFEWGIEMENGGYFFPPEYDKEFTDIMRILTFVELGDIEVKILEAGKNNGKSKNDGKIHNSSPKTVYVVDSSWNQIIIRTEGFAVRGHFKLQPCGVNSADRKLIWIAAFEKLGYKRRPKAEIAS